MRSPLPDNGTRPHIVQTTAFTTPAYSASQNRQASHRSFGLWPAVCFVIGTLFGFQGRISRLDYWIFGTAYSAIALFGYSSFAIHAGSWNWSNITSDAHGLEFQAQFFLFCFVMIMLRLSLEARRFQDRGFSGYWYFGYLVPVLNLYLLLANSLKPGTPKANKYDL